MLVALAIAPVTAASTALLAELVAVGPAQAARLGA